jgi:hypothetical protein
LNAIAFAKHLATSLAAVLPSGFAATAVDAAVHLSAPDALGVTSFLAAVNDVSRGSERFETSAYQVLSAAQDLVSQATGMPWPRAAGDSLNLVLPFTRVEGQTLHLGFGDGDAPTISLAPIFLGEDPR